MPNKTFLLAVVSGAVLGSALLFIQPGEAVASVKAAEPVATVTAPAVVQKPISRRERMARIVAEQAAITAEASARRTLARKAVEGDTAMR